MRNCRSRSACGSGSASQPRAWRAQGPQTACSRCRSAWPWATGTASDRRPGPSMVTRDGHLNPYSDGQKETDMTPSERIRDDASRAQWAAGEGRRLIAFARGSRHRDGFGWLDEDGRTDPDRPVATYVTAWMT